MGRRKERASIEQAGIEQGWRRREECGSSKLFYPWPTQAMARRGICTAGRRLSDMERILWSCLWCCYPPGMREGMTLRCAAEVIDVWITVQVCVLSKPETF